jgi:hypothetical protein
MNSTSALHPLDIRSTFPRQISVVFAVPNSSNHLIQKEIKSGGDAPGLTHPRFRGSLRK